MKTAVVLGAYGLIGSACMRALEADGFRTVGVGRRRAAALRSAPDSIFVERDIAKTDASDWRSLLADTDVVVNASGALQDGARDSLSAIHERAIGELVVALGGTRTRLIQISAAGVSEAATTEFFRSKARGDGKIMGSDLDWVILRPTLVVGAEAYGGTALLRAAAAVPAFFPKILPESRIQTVFLGDVAAAVVSAARGEVPSRTLADLTEPEARSFADTVRALRKWQGFAPWTRSVPVPMPLVRFLALGADALGWLGWRSPLRTTAIRSLQAGVLGDPAAWRAAGGADCRPLTETLAALPSTAQERWFARLYLLMPLCVATLSIFWILSGLIGLAEIGAAETVLLTRGFSPSLAGTAALGGAVLDLALGLAILYRPLAQRACLAMLAAGLAYLLAATVFAPDLWADPLGPLVKILPASLLALVTAALLGER
ncbi:SDR family oxidoreductase [Aurantimonas sp. VKM B-3413]|uniref:SDR family oxidoreductase n=1 Tax=Aurantimonas sp. VKM B-3413 TaxID=2779401 RepID=UPI001E624F88|nr:SDR family oxidoreductase [Aurantimonas sp. VKM B-3413]MCB8840721.1 SDR family oxidoreductase [Aurantimonas sp. VKM B-3413]